jgi:hypothetical protein
MEGNGSNGEAWRGTSPRPRARALSLSQAVSLPLYFSPSRGRRSMQNKFFKKKRAKITAQSIPMWSPTIVLTLPSTV